MSPVENPWNAFYLFPMPRPKPTSPPSFDSWQREAIASIDPIYASRLSRIPHREWTRWYVRSLSPGEAGREAERVIWNSMTAGERLRFNPADR